MSLYAHRNTVQVAACVRVHCHCMHVTVCIVLLSLYACRCMHVTVCIVVLSLYACHCMYCCIYCHCMHVTVCMSLCVLSPYMYMYACHCTHVTVRASLGAQCNAVPSQEAEDGELRWAVMEGWGQPPRR